jgi:hypothetical protein
MVLVTVVSVVRVVEVSKICSRHSLYWYLSVERYVGRLVRFPEQAKSADILVVVDYSD